MSATLVTMGVLLGAGGLRAADSSEALRSGSALAPVSAAEIKARAASEIPAVPQAAQSPEPEQARNAGSAQPNLTVTPGHLCTPADPNFKEYRYAEHIAYCNRNVTQQMKQQVAASYNVPQANWTSYEFDHLIPLCIGGDSSVDNLWPQPRGQNDADSKDKLENDLFNQMSAGTLSQKAAIQQIYDWFKRYAARHPEARNTPLAAALN